LNSLRLVMRGGGGFAKTSDPGMKAEREAGGFRANLLYQ
jgi:hypothetical protein